MSEDAYTYVAVAARQSFKAVLARGIGIGIEGPREFLYSTDLDMMAAAAATC